MKTVIHWFRRDLRLTDNPALHAAVSQAQHVIPVYILSTWKKSHSWTGPNRQSFLCGCLASLAKDLKSAGSRLIFRRGDAIEELEKLARETGAEAIFFNRATDPHGRATERRLQQAAVRLSLTLHSFKDVAIHERDEVLTKTGDSFRVFTPYAQAWAKLPKPSCVDRIRSIRTPAKIQSLPLPQLENWGLQPDATVLEAGKSAALRRLDNFLCKGILTYGIQRDTLSGQNTSRLSQDLRFGLLSVRQVYHRCVNLMRGLPATHRNSIQVFLRELIWREFYMQILWHHPEVLEVEFNPKYRHLPWPGKKEHFARWSNGETGFPIVDAAMRELHATGFMHNRARMITAMFLCKDLQLDWRLGEQFFMQKLVDGEIASNNGGWQWSAGTGADAAPYFRIQNPWTQTARYDPDGEYIKTWIPELRDVPATKFTRPPKEGETLSRHYPAPIVNHAIAREKTLRLFASHQSGN